MAVTKLTGSGSVVDADFKYIKWVGKTKAGQSVTIEMPSAICKSNPDWKFAEKDDTVVELEFEGVYDDDVLATGDRKEPWTVTIADGAAAGNGEIMLGVGKFYIGSTSLDAACIGLTRGGGSFVVEREYREIAADEDPGAVKGRIVQDAGRPKLKVTALQWLTKIEKMYTGMTVVTE